MNPYEIYVAKVFYYDSNRNLKSENSPIMILTINPKVIAAKITHHKARMCNQNDYEIQNLIGTGLKEDSTLMLDYPFELDTKNILYKIGVLNAYDQRWIQTYIDTQVNL